MKKKCLLKTKLIQFQELRNLFPQGLLLVLVTSFYLDVLLRKLLKRINIVSFFPTRALLFEIGFVLSKFIGFYVCLNTFYTSNTINIIFLLVIFSLSWSIGLVVPAAPGGIGVFEGCLLFFVGRNIPQNAILVSLIYFRVISTFADFLLSVPFLIRKLFKRI